MGGGWSNLVPQTRDGVMDEVEMGGVWSKEMSRKLLCFFHGNVNALVQ